MSAILKRLSSGLLLAALQFAIAQGGRLNFPKTVEAGSDFSIHCTGNGPATLYIIGAGQVVKRDLQMGEVVHISAGSLCNAGHYLMVLAMTDSTESDSLDVLPAGKPADLDFLARPSRLPVGLHAGITGAVYVFDTYHNLIVDPTPISFELVSPSGSVQKKAVVTRDGAAWTDLDSTMEQGVDRFAVRLADLSSTRVVVQVPGDPCSLKMNVLQSGQKLQVATDPLRDCSGNAVSDGTVVTFTESYNGYQSTVDVPVKHGVAAVQMPANRGALLSVASGVVLGNQIRWEK